MRTLFICNQNQNRSKTAELMFKNDFETKSAGLYNNAPVSIEQLEWADLIVVMEDEQRKELGRRFPSIYMKKRIVSLEISDVYHYGQTELKRLLKEKMNNLELLA